MEMDYEEYIKKLGSFGKYQKRLLFIVFAPAIFNSFSTPVTNFFFGDQKFRCKLPNRPNDTFKIQNEEHQTIVNLTIPIDDTDGNYDGCRMRRNNNTLTKCSEWVYDQSIFTRTVTSQFDLVCDKKLLRSHAMMVYFIGTLTSTLLVTPLGDVIGRRAVIRFSTSIQFLVNIAMPFSINVFMFCVLRFLDGFCSSSYYQEAFVVGLELVGPSKRLLAGTFILLVFCFGEFLLAVIAFFIRDWKWLQLTLAIPMAALLLFWWPNVLPESPRWLISRGRNHEALKILHRAAKINGIHLDKNALDVRVNENKDGILNILKKLIKSKKLMVRWIIIFANWFTVAVIYYGTLVNVGQLGGNLYINFPVAVGVETLGYSLCLMMNKTGRKPFHLVTMFGSGIACLVSILPLMFADSSLNWITVTFAMIGRLGISAAFGEIFLYTGELFPTVVRSLVLGVSSGGARIGSTVSPYLYLLVGGKFGKALPLLIYGVMTIIVAVLSVMLPETNDRRLLEYVDDANHEEDLHISANRDMKTLPKPSEGEHVTDVI